MSLFQGSRYKALPRDDKNEHETGSPENMASKPRGWSKKLLLALFALLAAALLAFVPLAWVLSSGAESTAPPSVADAIPMDDESRGFLTSLARAGDQQYLLGVGKADITG